MPFAKPPAPNPASLLRRTPDEHRFRVADDPTIQKTQKTWIANAAVFLRKLAHHQLSILFGVVVPT